jgi:hypothetical protein
VVEPEVHFGGAETGSPSGVWGWLRDIICVSVFTEIFHRNWCGFRSGLGSSSSKTEHLVSYVFSLLNESQLDCGIVAFTFTSIFLRLLSLSRRGIVWKNSRGWSFGDGSIISIIHIILGIAGTVPGTLRVDWKC